ncbi:MAG TPA: sigma-70 family RNA polymerase sigma factor [Thermoanaerobaculia bacterium]|nr:sigma-70 family RNA polymerase sigma factor [Thermoanaerobaculia bacterium]
MRPDWREQGEEQALVRRMLAGDETAFAVFSDSYIPAVYRFAQHRLADRELTRDIVQATVCKAIAKLKTFRGESGLTTWLCACCQNEIAAHFRRQSRTAGEVELTEDVAAVDPALDEGLLQKERDRLVHVALDAIPPHYSRALEWKYLDRLPVEAIAARLGVRPKAAESLLTRARQSFREMYERITANPSRTVPRPWTTIRD